MKDYCSACGAEDGMGGCMCPDGTPTVSQKLDDLARDNQFLVEQIERMDAAFHFLSSAETTKRLLAKTPEHERRKQFEQTEADAIARHVARQQQE